jgi:phosphoribosylamine--glycine ligase
MNNHSLTILLVGSGAREHALAKTISRSSRSHKLVSFGSGMNPGIAELSAYYVSGNINDPEVVADFAAK